jgi:hypothetical protein
MPSSRLEDMEVAAVGHDAPVLSTLDDKLTDRRAVLGMGFARDCAEETEVYAGDRAPTLYDIGHALKSTFVISELALVGYPVSHEPVPPMRPNRVAVLSAALLAAFSATPTLSVSTVSAVSTPWVVLVLFWITSEFFATMAGQSGVAAGGEFALLFLPALVK